MKKNLINLFLFLVCVVIMLDLTGGTLAQPERDAPQQDQFIGFQLVPEKLNTVTEEDGSEWTTIGNNDRSHWVDYGTETLEVGDFGRVELPRSILIGTYNEQTHRYEFPGMEGFNCFLAIQTGEDGERFIGGYTDMMENHVAISETEHTLSGALYVKPNTQFKEHEWVLTAYRVYQMKDGTVYLDGTGSSYSGPGFTIREREEHTTTVNGASTVQTTEIEFSLKDILEIQKIHIVWFGENCGVLGQEEMDVEVLRQNQILESPAGTVWAVVEEIGGDGERVKRTTVEPDEQGQFGYRLILPDERGIGQEVWLNW